MTAEKKQVVITREEAVFRMDANGIWRNEHGRIEHPRIIKHFNRSIRRDDQGFYLYQSTDEFEEKVYFPYEETALFVVDLVSLEEGADLILNTGQKTTLEPKRLFVREDSLFIRTQDGPVKFTQQALVKISPCMEEGDQGLCLKLGKNLHSIPGV